MKKLLFALAFITAAFALGGHARAACATSYPYGPPNYLTNGVAADATTLWADLQDVRTCATTVDNTQIGPLGVFASQIIPTTVAQATFGGTTAYTFTAGLNVTGTLLVNGGAVPSVTAANTFTAMQTFSGGLAVTKASVNGFYIQPNADPTQAVFAAFNSNGPGPGSIAIFRVDDVDANNGAAYVSRNGANLGILPPMLTASGGQMANTTHSVWISTTTAGSTSTCGDAGAQYCSTVTLTGGAVFSAYNSYQCHTNIIGATPSMGEYYGGVTTGYGESHASGSVIKFWSASPSQSMVSVCVGT